MLISENYLGEKTYYVYGLGLISEEKNSDMTYYHFDCRGSTIALTDASELVTDTFAYDAYGKVMSHTSSSATMFKYVGQYGVTTDTDTLYFMMTRYYSTDTRRFINQDTLLGSIAQSLSTNQYAYLKGNPTGYVDPDGRLAIPIIYGIGKAFEVGLTLYVTYKVLENNHSSYPRNYVLKVPKSNAFSDKNLGHFSISNDLRNTLSIYYNNVEDGAVESKGNDLQKNPDDLLKEGWKETTDPRNASGGRDFTNPKTGEKVRFDPGKPGRPGWEGKYHYHRHNPDSTGKFDYYLDGNGNPVPKGSNPSHLLPK